MSRSSNCIRMLLLLQDGCIHKISDLAIELETNERNISEYKRELELAGYYIEGITGKNGGYRLIKDDIFPALRLTAFEKDSLIDAFAFLDSNVEFLADKYYASAKGKIFSSMKFDDAFEKNDELKIINKHKYIITRKDLNEIYLLINNAIDEARALEVCYSNDENVIEEFSFHPYDLFMFDDMWHIIGWNNKALDICIYKLNKITSLRILNESFRIIKGYDLDLYVDDFGIKSKEQWHRIVFVAENQYSAYVKERCYGRNQVVEEIDSNHTRVSVDMQDKEKITSFILSFTDDITVLEPKWLIDELKRHADVFYKKYGGM